MPTGPDFPLAALLQHRWNIAVIAELGRSGGAKFVTLCRRLEVSRGSLTASLKHLVRTGLVRRNSGYGHPLRPEYLLTPAGERLAAAAAALDDFVAEAVGKGVAYRKWSLPLILVIGKKERRFNELRDALPGVTPRALVLAVKALEKAGWVDRQVDAGYPPTTTYALSEAGCRLLALAERLVQSAAATLRSS